MRAYTLAVNGKTVAAVDVPHYPWLPVRPSVPRQWLVGVVQRALRVCVCAARS